MTESEPIDLPIEDKVKIAAEFLKDSPPGEFHEVLNDVRNLIRDDVKLQAGIKHICREHNTSQFIVANLDEEDNSQKALVIEHAEMDDHDHPITSNSSYFYHPATKRVFKFDHLRQIASQISAFESHPSYSGDKEPIRCGLQSAFSAYIKDHYQEGVDGTYYCLNERRRLNTDKIVLAAASNKFSPSNFWNGRWRTQWIVDLVDKKLEGDLKVQVHYYEDGNVQLNTHKAIPAIDIKKIFPGSLEDDKSISEFASAVIEIVKDAESKYQLALNESYGRLSDETFKTLRRMLPVTRSKVEWDKIAGYKIGKTLNQ